MNYSTASLPPLKQQPGNHFHLLLVNKSIEASSNGEHIYEAVVMLNHQGGDTALLFGCETQGMAERV
eukprot:1160783-Pelagomonas_calceolata.AAC.9